MSVLTIVDKSRVEEILNQLLPYLKVKQRTAKLLLEIIKDKKTIINECDFLKVCQKVDKVAEYTDSKNRKITSEIVKQSLKTTCRD
jgi:ABC-type taurine transport system substrate-binding protein